MPLPSRCIVDRMNNIDHFKENWMRPDSNNEKTPGKQENCTLDCIVEGAKETRNFVVSTGDGSSNIFVGIMAAFWAIRTGRNPVTWFLFGMFLPPIACLAAWIKNRKECS